MWYYIIGKDDDLKEAFGLGEYEAEIVQAPNPETAIKQSDVDEGEYDEVKAILTAEDEDGRPQIYYQEDLDL